MNLLKLLRRSKPVVESKPENEIKKESNGKTLESHSENQDLILVELKQISNRLISLDSKLTRHDEVTINYLVDLLAKKNVISSERKAEVLAIIQKAIAENRPKAEAVQELIDLGVPRSTAFRYAENLKSHAENLESHSDTDLATENK